MSRVLVTEQYLQNIADSIRAKRGTEDEYTPAQMASAIGLIHGDPVVQEKTVTRNGIVTPDAGYDGLSKVTVNVPNTYTSGDEGKVVKNGALVQQTDRTVTANGRYNTTTNKSMTVEVSGDPTTIVDKTIIENGTYDAEDDDADGFGQVTVDVPNSYDASDEGKVVDDGELVAQTSKNISTNGTHDTTLNHEVVVAVPNTYGAADEGKVVDNGALVAQTSIIVTENGTVDTTKNNQVVVNVSGGGNSDNMRNYSISVYDLDLSENDYLAISLGAAYAHTSFAWALVTEEFEIAKIMTAANAATSGAYRNDNGCVLYGTFNDASGGAVIGADYVVDTTITTNDPGSGYKSSFIIWLTTDSESEPHIIDSDTGGNQSSTTVVISAAMTAAKKLIFVAMNGDTNSIKMSASVSHNQTLLTSEYTEHHDYSGPGGGGSATLITKTVTQNGTYDAEDDDADGYSSVSVNVPNSYAAGDEGKVVSNGALVAQTARSSEITQNGSYDTTNNNSVTVNVSGGGGSTALCDIDFSKASTSFSWHNVQISSGGAVFSRNDNYITLPFARSGGVIEVDVVSTSMSNATNNRFITIDDTNKSLCFHKDTGRWSVYSGSAWYDTEISDKQYFDGSTVKIVIDANNKWHVYKNNVIVWEPNAAIAISNGIWTIGSSSNAIDGAVISGIRVY